MSNSYKGNRKWADQFNDQIIKILGSLLIKPAPDDLDRNENTDFMLYTGKDMRVSSRLSRIKKEYIKEDIYTFTVRSKLDSGASTEMSKICRGFGDWAFFGHCSDETILHWMIVDLGVLRSSLIEKGFKGWDKLVKTVNCKDGTSFFVFDVRHFARNLVIASSFVFKESWMGRIAVIHDEPDE